MNQPDRVQQLLNRKPYLSIGVSGYYLSNGNGSAFEDELMKVYKSKTGKVYEMTSRCERPAMIRPSSLSETCQEYTLDD